LIPRISHRCSSMRCRGNERSCYRVRRTCHTLLIRPRGHGTLTAGNGPVRNGTKWASPRDIAESATRAVMMIVISRIGCVLNDPDPAAEPERAALTLQTKVLSPPVESCGFLRCAIGRGELLALLLGLMVSRCNRFCRPGKSSGPPPFAPPLNVQGDVAHNSSGLGGDSRPQSPNNFPKPREWRWAQLCCE
jgi:hypothetical protein